MIKHNTRNIRRTRAEKRVQSDRPMRIRRITEGLDKVNLAENIVHSLNEIDGYDSGDKWEIIDTKGNYIVIKNDSYDDYVDGLFCMLEVGDSFVSCFRAPDQEGGDFVLIGKFRSDDPYITNKISQLVGGTEFYMEGDMRLKKAEAKQVKKGRRRFESVNMDDSELKKWAAEHCIDRLDEMEGVEVYMDDLATELTENENMNGTVFMSTQKSWDFIAQNRYDAGDVLEEWVSETGSCKPNPLSDPDGFCVLLLEHYVREVLDECPSMDSLGSGKKELTRDMIDALSEDLEQFC